MITNYGKRTAAFRPGNRSLQARLQNRNVTEVADLASRRGITFVMVANNRSRERNRQQDKNCPGENRVGARGLHLHAKKSDYS